jgi:hypothetical protein
LLLALSALPPSLAVVFSVVKSSFAFSASLRENPGVLVRGIHMKIYAALQILILLGLSQTALAETCFPFMPEKSTIQGMVKLETPPKDAAKPEPYYVMHLAKPICLAPGEKDTTNKGVDGISKVQLNFRGMKQEMFGKLKPRLMSDEIKCTGMFFGRHMPHHYTGVLMWTTECEAVGAKSPDIAL